MILMMMITNKQTYLRVFFFFNSKKRMNRIRAYTSFFLYTKENQLVKNNVSGISIYINVYIYKNTNVLSDNKIKIIIIETIE